MNGLGSTQEKTQLNETLSIEKEKLLDKYHQLDTQFRSIVKNHPLAMIGLALAAGFITHAIIEKALKQTEN